MSKYRLINIFIDGTSNHPEQENKKGEWIPTNIWRQYQTLTNLRYLGQNKLPKDIVVSAYYHRGIGAPVDKAGKASIHRVFDNKMKARDPYIVDCDLDESVELSLSQKFGLATGFGLTEIMLNNYRYISEQFALAQKNGEEPVLQIFGFSRGAATARTLTSMLDKFGLARVDNNGIVIEKDVQDAINLYRSINEPEIKLKIEKFVQEKGLGKSTKVDFLGVYDTVPALGVPGSFPRLKSLTKSLFRKTDWVHDFHDFTISPNVIIARHALSADEQRVEFNSNEWDNHDKDKCDMEQRIFPGSHSEVGGGVEDRGLPDTSMSWMMKESQKAIDNILGMSSVQLFTQDSELVTQKLNPNSSGKIVYKNKKLPYLLSYEASWVTNLFKKGKSGFFKRDFSDAVGLTIDKSIQERKSSNKTYQPAAIIPKNTPIKND